VARFFVSVLVSVVILMTTLIVPTVGHAAERATTNRQTELKESADNNSRAIAPLAANVNVMVIARQGEWVRLDAAGQQGWVPEAHVKLLFVFKEAAPIPKGGFLSWFTAVLKPDQSRISSGSSASSRVGTATAGIRGLGEDGAKAAKSNSEELQKLKLYSVSRSDADDFARNAGLVPSHIEYIN
jgi:hypothetical protein